MKTKVIQLINSLDMGGAETLVTDYALKIDKSKFEIIVVTVSSSRNTVNENKLKNAGIKVIYLGNEVAFPRATGVIKRIINKVNRYILFYRIINIEKPNVIHTHLGTNAYLIPINTKRREIKLFHTIHNELKLKFKKMSKRLSTYYCIKWKNMIPITLHSKMQKETNDLFNIYSSLVVPNAIDISRFTHVQEDKFKVLDTLQLNNSSFIVGHVGRFAEQKNHKFLIEIFKNVVKKRPDAHLILIGIGRLESEVKDQVKEYGLENYVSFLGNRGDIPELMSIMNIFVFPSLFEGFGNVLIEAQAAGVKCIASDRIPKEAFVTNLATKLPLNESTEKWANAIINEKYPNVITGDLEKHDINNVIKHLEDLYVSSD